MIPAPYPLCAVFTLPSEDGSVWRLREEHPVVGWDDGGAPLGLHWTTGRITPISELVAARGNVISVAYLAQRLRPELDEAI